MAHLSGSLEASHDDGQCSFLVEWPLSVRTLLLTCCVTLDEACPLSGLASLALMISGLNRPCLGVCNPDSQKERPPGLLLWALEGCHRRGFGQVDLDGREERLNVQG